MADFNTQDDYYEEEVPRRRRTKGQRGLPLWPLLVIVLVILIVVVSLLNPFAPSPPPTVEIIPTVTQALPTLPPLSTVTFTPQPTITPTPAVPTEIKVGGYVKVVNSGADGLRFRWGGGENYATKKVLKDGTILKVLEGPEEADGFTWWRLEDPAEEDEDLRIGWAADDWLKPTLP
jgi:hypothetical protein